MPLEDYEGMIETIEILSENPNIAKELKKEKKELLIKVTDNGKGLIAGGKEILQASSSPELQRSEANEHISRASQIIKDRIYLLNIKLKTKARFTIDNNENGQGVIVNIHLPILYKQDIKA